MRPLIASRAGQHVEDTALCTPGSSDSTCEAKQTAARFHNALAACRNMAKRYQRKPR